MAGTVSVLGAQGHVNWLTYESAPNLKLANKLADKINAEILSGIIIPSPNNTAPTIRAGYQEYVQTTDSTAHLSKDYRVVVFNDASGTVDGSAATHQEILAGTSNATYKNLAPSASGAISFGSGNNNVQIGALNSGNWLINTGNGNDTISAFGQGDSKINAGLGHDQIRLGAGRDQVTVAGTDTVVGGAGKATIFGGQGLTFVGGSGDALVYGGTGSTRFVAGTGNETLVGGGGSDGRNGTDTFEFLNGTQGHDLIENFSPGDKIELTGFGSNAIGAVLSTQHLTSQGVTITLSDNTRITFTDIRGLSASDFIKPNR